MSKKKFLNLFLIFITLNTVNAQIIEINKTGEKESVYTPKELVEKILITGNCTSVDGFSSVAFGTPTNNTRKSYGYFKSHIGSTFPFKEGIILTTGNAWTAGNTPSNATVNGIQNQPGDTDLETALNVTDTNDATFIKFNFTPLASEISFRFLMASEEYDGILECTFADSFAFLLREVGTVAYTNLAVLPDVNRTPVSVTNINNAAACKANTEYFKGYNLKNTNYGGRTKVLIAKATVIPNKIYEIKLVVADQGDALFDSAVFLEAGSFNLGIDLGEDFLIASNTAACNSTQLLDAKISASSYKWFKDNVLIPGQTNKTYLADLGDGVYKVEAKNGTSCISTDEIKLEFVTTTIKKPNDWKYCDLDNDGFHAFDIKAKMDSEVLNGQDPLLFTVTYFSSKSDAIANTNPFSNPYTNKSAHQTEKIYAKVTNNKSTNCYQITDFDIIINNLPIPQTPSNYVLCDDIASGTNTDGFTSSFLLSSKDSEILGTLTPSNHNVSYHLSLSDAQNNLNAIDKNAPYKNTTINSQTIYVRVSNNSGCSNETTNFNLKVTKIPVVQSIAVYEQCDVDSNTTDGITTFNLQSKENELTKNASNVVVDFFETTDINFTSPITNKVGYINIFSTNFGNHKLNVRLTNTITNCNSFDEIELKVNASKVTKPILDMYVCEIDQSATIPESTSSNGSGEAFLDFNIKTNEIIANSNGAFSLAGNDFEYYRTINDASLQTSPIITPYSDDLFTNNSEIFVRVSTKGTNVCNGISSFKVVVNPLPIPQGTTEPIYLCLNNPIDNPQLITTDLNADTGTPTDTYQWFLNGHLITGATSAVHKANIQGTYKVEAYRMYQNNITDTSDDSSCLGYNTFTVKESNKAFVISTIISDDQDSPNKNSLDVKISGIGNYQFSLNSTNTADFTNGSDNFNFALKNIKPGVNTVYILDTNGCGITSSQQLSFLFFQRHFSPNNDGLFDTWKIIGATNSFYPTAKVRIFNRYGRVMAIIDEKIDHGWDGTYNGNKLPSNDYWYNAVLVDINGNIRKKTGHFSLLRK